jgi:beta-phosphoglucomutase-like phosphatase (HAD superfamily)
VVALAEVASKDVLIFVYQKGEARFTDLIKEFVDPGGKCARQTLLNYKRDLEISKKLGKKISEQTRRPVYYIPDEHKKEIEDFLKKKQLHDYVNDANAEELERLRIVYELEKSKNERLKSAVNTLIEQLKKNDSAIVAMQAFLAQLPNFIQTDGKPVVVKADEMKKALKAFTNALEQPSITFQE